MAKQRINVLVSSAGTASAINVINGLKKQEEFDIHITAVDMDLMAAGLYLADNYFIVPSLKEDNYIPKLIEICKRNKIDFYFPIYSKEIELIAGETEIFENINVKLLLSTPQTIRNSNDKIYMNELVQKLDIQVPQSFNINKVDEIKFPVFIKYNFSSGSSRVAKISTKRELSSIKESEKEKLIIQEYIEAEEITVDVFCNNQHEAKVISPRIRLSTKAGQAVKARTVSNEMFIEPVTKICTELKIKGSCNIQFFRKNNKLIFIEINPRFAAGGLGLTINAGANIPLLILKEGLGMSLVDNNFVAKEGVLMTRYWKEIYLND